jgi:hypothetical protein
MKKELRKAPFLGRQIKFMNEDTYDYMDVIIKGYYVKEFTKKIKETLRIVECNTGTHKYINKWKIVKDKKLRCWGVGKSTD